jgi:hypothetical protein
MLSFYIIWNCLKQQINKTEEGFLHMNELTFDLAVGVSAFPDFSEHVGPADNGGGYS